MQNREELRQKTMIGVEKRREKREKNIIFRRGEGINIVFGPKYRPMFCCAHLSSLWIRIRDTWEWIPNPDPGK
jgi:hypothetical protein